MKISIHKNTSTKKFGSAKLPIGQRLFWFGALFILVQTGASQ